MSTRPRYVRPEDVANEAKAGALVSDWFNRIHGYHCTATATAPGSAFDFTLMENGKIIAIAEFKRRKGWGTQYDTWHISKHKLESLAKEAKASGVPALLVFEWDDGLFIADLAKLGSTSEKIGGRYDRGDVHDQEVMVNISRTVFQFIK